MLRRAFSTTTPSTRGRGVETRAGASTTQVPLFAPIEMRVGASTTPVPLFTLFALRAALGWDAKKSNNVKGGT